MEAKFHIFDGNGLKHYRMIYESGFESREGLTIEILYRLVYNGFYSSYMEMPEVNVTSTGYVKIFEYVKGARITGKANVDEVLLRTFVQTNQGRIFVYEQKVKPENGTYEFIVPYAQNTTYPVKPVTPYQITAGNVTKTLSLVDEDVLEGKTITLDFM
jgi:dolichyl-diphosphooligosaccharide--protein glycosyltransferase